MIDPRFYNAQGALPARVLADGLELRGDPEALVAAPAPLSAAVAGSLAYCEKRFIADTPVPAGACVLTTAGVADLFAADVTVIITQRPRAAFARLAPRLIAPITFPAGPATVDPTARIEAGAVVCAGAVIGPGAEIGAGAHIGPNAVIGPGVAIGRGSRIGANASIAFTLMGDGCTVLAGAVLGEAGFGVAVDAEGTVDVPHFGRVIVQDGATIGANTTIDRGVFDDTVIGAGSKIDNLCQIGHNVRLGQGVMIAAFGGISGSTVIEDGVRFGGRVGIADHRVIGKGATLAAGAAVMHDVPAGETWGGYPARAFRAWMREVAWVRRKSGQTHDPK